MGSVASHSTVWQAAFEKGWTTGRGGGGGTYATFIRIRANVVTSPSSKLKVTFLQPTIGGRTRQSRRQKAYSSCSAAICAMPAGSVPSRRLSPAKLPHHNQCKPGAARSLYSTTRQAHGSTMQVLGELLHYNPSKLSCATAEGLGAENVASQARRAASKEGLRARTSMRVGAAA